MKTSAKKMILTELVYFFGLVVMLGSTTAFVSIHMPLPVSHAETVAPDNSRMNKRDSTKNTLTPEDQLRGSDKDVSLTRKIRERLTRDATLSAYAKNVKIITLDGKTTLRGPVSNGEESLFIEKVARGITGREVNNQLEVVTK